MSSLPEAHQRLLEEIRQEVRLTSHYTGRSALDRRVLEALKSVPHEQFVPDGLEDAAYENHPLPIGHGQTISQPYIVAIMTELLDLQADDRVLEIGTGSGYQAGILSRLVAEVYSVEIIPALSRQAGEYFEKLGCHNIHTRVGNGYFGWPEESPFDAIMITAATPEVPPPLIEQLKPGGHLVAPLGSSYSQSLTLLTKQSNGEIRYEDLLPVVFVPLTGGSTAEPVEHP